MKRTPGSLAQVTFDSALKLQSLSNQASLPVRIVARILGKVMEPLRKSIGSGHTVEAQVYGRKLTMPTEHPLPAILVSTPHYNRPLALSARAIAATDATRPLSIIDVGANIGDTVALIDQYLPGICSYLCIEPEADLAEICRLNHQGNVNVRTERHFVGETEGVAVRTEDDGRANPSTKRVDVAASDDASVNRLVLLDTLALPFATSLGHLSLIKVDTEGYDFSILRSGEATLSRYKPHLYFEWFPSLLVELQQAPEEGFLYLQKLGYRYFVFYTNSGGFYCEANDPTPRFLRGLANVTSSASNMSYFDVFASTNEPVRDALLELSLSSTSR